MNFPVSVLPGGGGGPGQYCGKCAGPGAWVLDLGQSTAEACHAGSVYLERRRDLGRLPNRSARHDGPRNGRMPLRYRRPSATEPRRFVGDFDRGSARCAYGEPTSLAAGSGRASWVTTLVPGRSSVIGMGVGDAELVADVAVTWQVVKSKAVERRRAGSAGGRDATGRVKGSACLAWVRGGRGHCCWRSWPERECFILNMDLSGREAVFYLVMAWNSAGLGDGI